MSYRARAQAHYEQHLSVVQSDLDREEVLLGGLYRRNLLPHLPPDRQARILDLGCGFGIFLRFLADAGYANALGVDSSPGMCAVSQARGHSPREADNLAFLRSGGERFDCITLNHVIEHYTKEEALELLDAVHARLAPGGRALVMTPNMGSPVAAARSRYMDITHETGYTEESLLFLMKLAGFAPVQVLAVDQFCLPSRFLNLCGRAAERAWHAFLRVLYLLHAVRSTRIYTKNLLAVGERPRGLSD